MSNTLATKHITAALVGVGLVFAFSFAFATPAKAQTIAELQAQVQALLAQIQALQQGGGTSGGACFTFTRSLTVGSTGDDVMQLQKFLNSHGAQVAATGAGSPGNESTYFGTRTKAAVAKFQTDNGISPAAGYFGPITRAKVNSMCPSGTGGTGGVIPTGSGLTVIAGAQPPNSLAVNGASRVPFTTFTLTNNSAAPVTVSGVTVQKSGLGDKAVFDGLILVDSNGVALGNSKTLNSNNQAVLDAGITLQPGQSQTLTVAGNMISDLGTPVNYSGQVIGISVVGINASSAVTGSLPIMGAMHTINSTLSIGSLTMAVGPDDPNTTALNSSTAGKPIGTTGFVFASVRATNSGSNEDVWIKSIRWNQSGSASASDLANLVTIVDGVSYPMTVSADGKYYTVVFPGSGLEIRKGLSKSFTVKGDIIGGPARTISFDIYKRSDVYVVGGTYGYGITPAQGNGTVSDASEFTAGSPYFSGTVVQINAGSVSSVSRANEVAAQNIVLLSPNQPLGGFAVDIKGEPITVSSITFGFVITGGDNGSNIDNITLVDANGAVVAGPVDGTTGTGTNGKVTFTDTVTFPTGRNVFTLKGQLDSSFGDGDTIQATTTPNSTYWTNARGSITGNSITISNTDVTSNIMTVRAGQVVLSVAGTPAAQTIVAGATNQLVSAIDFNASQSGEDIRFNSAKFLFTESLTGTDDITNCAAYQGATRLNSVGVNYNNTGDDLTYTFDTPLVVKKGEVARVEIRCDVPASITGGTFSIGFTSGVTFTGTGLTSSQTITPTSSTGSTQAGNTMTVSTGGALTVALDASSPAYRAVAAGTTDVTLAALRFTGTNEDMALDRIALQLSGTSASSSPNNLVKVTVWDGSTKVGEATFAGTRFATTSITTGTTNVGGVMKTVIPANGSKVLTIKGDLAGIGIGQATTTSGILITVGYDGNDSTGTRAIGIASGSTINTSTTSDKDPAGVRVYRTVPSITYAATSGSLGNGNQSLATVTVAADPKNDVTLRKLTFSIATTSATLSSPTFIGPNGSVGTVTVSGVTGSQVITVTFDSTTNTGDRLIPANGSKSFTLGGTVSGITGSGAAITIALKADTAYPALATELMGTVSDLSSASTIWSPNSTTTPADTGSPDWANNFGLGGCFAQSGLGTDCLSVSKSN